MKRKETRKDNQLKIEKMGRGIWKADFTHTLPSLPQAFFLSPPAVALMRETNLSRETVFRLSIPRESLTSTEDINCCLYSPSRLTVSLDLEQPFEKEVLILQPGEERASKFLTFSSVPRGQKCLEKWKIQFLRLTCHSDLEKNREIDRPLQISP